MKTASPVPFIPFFISFLCLINPLAAQILYQDFDALSSVGQFQGNPPNIGQVNRINLTAANDGSSIFSLGAEGDDQFLLIQKKGRQFRHFDRTTGINNPDFLKVSFSFSVSNANQNGGKFGAIFLGDNLGNSSFYPQKEERWAQIGIYVHSNGSFKLTNEIVPNDSTSYLIMHETEYFTGERRLTLFMNNSGNPTPLVYTGPDGEASFLPHDQIHVWVGNELKIISRAYIGNSSAINSFKFLTWGNNVNATARFDDFEIDPDVPFIPISEYVPQPVELTLFTAKKAGDDILLEWRTATEKNSSHFEVERSFNGRDFQIIGVVNAAGNSKVEKSYAFHDQGASQRLAGTVYYRLHQVDFDGASEYSPTSRVDLPSVQTPVKSVYPNPFEESLTLGLLTDKQMELNIRLLNMQGKAVMESRKQVNPAGEEQMFRLPDSSNLQSGVYILEINAAGEKQHFRIIKL